jgi:hypothetical protein
LLSVPIQIFDLHRVDTLLLGDTPPGAAESAGRMRLVDHEPSIVAALELDQTSQIRCVAVHAVESFHHDQGTTMARAVEPQGTLECVEVVVRAENSLGARQFGTLDDAVVDDRVSDNQVFRSQQFPDHRHVGAVAAHERDRVFGAAQARQGRLEVAVHLAFAGR